MITCQQTSADIATHSFSTRMCSIRLLATPADELLLALSKNPDARADRFVDPKLSAVYVVGNAVNSLVKIGYADNLRHRFAGLNVGSPVDLDLRHFVYFIGSLVAKNVEGRVHQRLAEHRRRGEWFDVECATAAAAIAGVAQDMRLKWWTEAERRDIGCRAWNVHLSRVTKNGF